LSIFRKSVDKITISLKSDKNNGYFIWRRFHLYDNISIIPPWNEKCFSQKLQRKSKHTFYVQQLFSENRALYEIMSRSVEESEGETNDVTIWRKRFVCWISKSTCTYAHPHTHALWYPHARTHTQTNIVYLLLFYNSNNLRTRLCYVIRTLHVLLKLRQPTKSKCLSRI
jgi:hypothetical protein